MKQYMTSLSGLFLAAQLLAQSGSLNLNIKVDQFGYLPAAQKIAVISSPQTGYNSAQTFTPGGNYQVRDWTTDAVIFSGSPTVWNSGATHNQSGDKVSWFNFSGIQVPGTYYILDVTNNARSVPFDINECAYANAMEAAVRAFYYQRCGHTKATPHADAKWADGICHHGTQQDLDCRLVSNPVASTSKNLSGGWHDAGDYNKYVSFTYSTLVNMLLAYEHNPSAFADNYGIPESGNGVPDLLDEVKWELNWLRRMQNSDGSILHKVSVTDFSAASPPSADNAFRRYGAASTLATATGACVFALAAIQFEAIGQFAYADTLSAAAINAWNWCQSNPNVVFSNTGFSNVSSESDDYDRLARRVAAATFLYKRTGLTTYRDFVDANYLNIHLLQWWFAYPFEQTHQDALLYYTTVPNATTSVKTDILHRYAQSMQTANSDNLPSFTNQSDAYRAFLKNDNYTWGSNQTKAAQGSMFFAMDILNQNTSDSLNHRDAGMGFVHYLHGINPTAYCYLSNMSSYGAEFSVPEIYHGWFADGTVFDNADTSLRGPAPGLMAGGANPNFVPDGAYGGTIVPPQQQPIQKSFKAWNTGWPQNSWEITEPAIYTNAAYIRLLADAMRYTTNLTACINSCPPPQIIAPAVSCVGQPTQYAVEAGPAGTTYAWTVTNGTIIAGQGTPIITVIWNAGAVGQMSISVTDP